MNYKAFQEISLSRLAWGICVCKRIALAFTCFLESGSFESDSFYI